MKTFQARHGLKETGLVQGATLKAMNVPANVRFTELASSAQRLAGRPFNFASRYVVVNIPSTAVETVENGVVHKRYVAVVGDPDHPSPEVDTKAVAVNLNPTWTLPVSIIKNEIIPKMQKNPGYLAKEKIRILDGTGHEVNPRSVDWSGQHATNFILRQDSGTANALGSIRINMPNKYAVYMHDTPSKRFFGADFRFLSHGCVRVQGVYDHRGLAAAGHARRTGRAMDQKHGRGQDRRRRAPGSEARGRGAGDLGLHDGLVERRRAGQLPRRRLRARHDRRPCRGAGRPAGAEPVRLAPRAHEFDSAPREVEARSRSSAPDHSRNHAQDISMPLLTTNCHVDSLLHRRQ